MKLFCVLITAVFSACLADAADVGVRMGTYFFNPTNIVISPGDRVVWTNNSDRAHDTTSRTSLWSSPNVGIIAPNNTYGFTFTNAGYYPYFCRQHVLLGPQQTGSVSVVAISLASVLKTPTNAQFTINGGRQGLKAVVEAGASLSGLSPIATNTFPASGSLTFTNSSPPPTNRFYRARVIP